MRKRGADASRRRATATISTAMIASTLVAPVRAGAEPDLLVSSVRRPPSFTEPGRDITVGDTVKNRGTKAAGTSFVQYLLSRDAQAGGGDVKIGRRRVGRLAPGEKSTDTTRVTIPQSTDHGIYYVLACADGNEDVPESSEKNNCKRSTTSMLIDEGLRVTPNPLEVQRTLSSAHEVTEEIDASAGGTVETTGPDGTTYTLDIPRHALFADTEIEMTPVATITGADEYFEGNVKEAAVELEPEGLRLYKSATLTIEPPGGGPLDPDGYTFEKAGENFHLYPLNLEASAYVFDLFHFSTYGVGGDADWETLAELEPESLEAQEEVDVSDIVERWKNGEIDHDGFLAEFSSVAVRHYFREILPAFAAAQSSEAEHELGVEALDAFSRWKLEMEVMGIDDYFNERYRVNLGKLIDYGLAELEKIAKTLFDKSWGRCRRGVQRARNHGIMATWGQLAEVVLSGATDVLGEGWQERLLRCINPLGITGEVTFESVWHAETDQRPALGGTGTVKTIDRVFSGTVGVSLEPGPVQGNEQTWKDKGTSTIDSTYAMEAEGFHDYGSVDCPFTEEQSFDLNGTISELENVAIAFHFDPANPGWYTDNASLSVSGSVSAPFSHDDEGSTSPCNDDNSGPRSVLFSTPTCPIKPFPDRPSAGMRGIFAAEGGLINLDFRCSGETTFEIAHGEGTDKYTISGTLGVGKPPT